MSATTEKDAVATPEPTNAIEFDFGFGLVAAVRRANGAIVALTAQVNADAEIGSYAKIGSDAEIGSYAKIGSDAEIGSYAKIGACAEIGSGAEIGSDAEIGSYAKIGAYAEIGADAVTTGRTARYAWTAYARTDEKAPGVYLQIGCQLHLASVWEHRAEEIIDTAGEDRTYANAVRALVAFVRALLLGRAE